MGSLTKLGKILLKMFGGEAGWARRLQKPSCPHLISSMNGLRTACQIQIDHRQEGEKCVCSAGDCPIVQQAIDEVEKAMAENKEAGKWVFDGSVVTFPDGTCLTTIDPDLSRVEIIEFLVQYHNDAVME